MALHVMWCNNNIEALKELRYKSYKTIMKWLNKAKIFEWQVLPYLFSPIDCSVIKKRWENIFEISNSNHNYLDSWLT